MNLDLQTYTKKNRSTLSTRDIENGRLFVACEVDIKVKGEFKQIFQEFPAVFAHAVFEWKINW